MWLRGGRMTREVEWGVFANPEQEHKPGLSFKDFQK